MDDPKASKKKTRKRIRGGNKHANASVSKAAVAVEGKMLTAQSLGETYNEAENQPSFSMKLRSRDVKSHVQEDGKESEGFVQDQIILAPEIMWLILDKLDLKSLKKVRLVCKSWNQEAQTHMRRSSIVRFQREGCKERIESFSGTYQKILPALPKPFESVDVNLNHWRHTYIYTYKYLFGKLRNLPLPLVITRFSPCVAPLKLALPLIIKWSSSLEYLELSTGIKCEAGYLPTMDPDQNFPKLKHINTSISSHSQNNGAPINYFPSVVSWIVNSSPSLDTFESCAFKTNLLLTELLQKIDITNVKRLIVWDESFGSGALGHFQLIPFSRLENLDIFTSEKVTPAFHEKAVKIVKNSAHTLKALSVNYDWKEQLPDLELPVCQNVYKLRLESFESSKLVISRTFPSLHVLKICWLDVDVLGDFWKELPPCVRLKTLRVGSCRGSNLYELPMKFFEKFPSLERLQMDLNFLLHCCQLKASDGARFPKTLDSVRHLEIMKGMLSNEELENQDYSVLRFLKGIETVTGINEHKEMIHIPFREMPSLKVLEFPFPERAPWDSDKLLEMAREMETVLVSNCCSIRTGNYQEAKDVLNSFFDSAPNAVCGCATSRYM